MKTFSVAFLLLLLMKSNKSYGQTLSELAPPLDSVEIYDCTFGMTRSGFGPTTYSVNGKRVTKQEYERVAQPFTEDRYRKCNPCYKIVRDLNERIVSKGVWYGVCPGDKMPALPSDTVYTGDKHYDIIIPSCYHGEWIYYDTLGKITERKRFEFGKQVYPPIPEKPAQ